MRTIGTTLAAIFVLVAIGSALGLVTNALRTDGIELSKPYFAKPGIVPPDGQAETPVNLTDEGGPAGPNVVSADKRPGEAAPPASGTTRGRPDHVFQVITLEEVMDLVRDPLYPGQLCVVIDSRGDEAYEVGHIRYARQMNPYHAERQLPAVLPEVLGAEKVVVYCEGGRCEDSIFASRELLENGVPYERIYLFEGGMEVWEKAGGPIDKGRD